MPEDEEKYFPSTGHSFKLRRPTGKKNRIRLNLVHEWPAFINVFSPNYSPLFLSLTSICRRLFGPRNSPDLRVRQKKKKARIALWLPWICNERLPRYFPLFRGEREKGDFIDERLPRCWISMESCDVLKPIAMHLRYFGIGSGNRDENGFAEGKFHLETRRWKRKERRNCSMFLTLSCSNPLFWLTDKYFFFLPPFSALLFRVNSKRNDVIQKEDNKIRSTLSILTIHFLVTMYPRINYQDLFSIEDVSFALAGRLKFLCRFARKG